MVEGHCRCIVLGECGYDRDRLCSVSRSILGGEEREGSKSQIAKSTRRYMHHGLCCGYSHPHPCPLSAMGSAGAAALRLRRGKVVTNPAGEDRIANAPD